MSDKLTADRFAYESNLAAAGSYRAHRSAFWPPSRSYALACLDLADTTPALGDGFPAALAALKTAVEAEWQRVKELGIPARRRFNEPESVAEAMREVAKHLPGEDDRRAAELRAHAVQEGYDDAILQELATLQEEFTVVAGQISTWYGKDVRGLPTAFGCRADETRQRLVTEALAAPDEVAARLGRLHADLRVGELPAFGAAELFFMAGEGNLHPKHIAYFLPEDEGVKYSPFKKTYYFANTHHALLESVSVPLAEQHLRLDARFDPAAPRCAAIPTLGVLSHELGHFVHRPATDFKELNAADRWASVVLQEVAADVFGILILADVWAPRLGIDPADCVAYYLAECLRYVDRGLGRFPDSDGMFLQLSYLTQLGALEPVDENGPRLAGETETVLAGLRSLARVLADSLLASDAQRSVRLHQRYGPTTAAPLSSLVEILRQEPLKSIEYTQEHLHATGTSAS
ncbi:hypothetical protein Q5762_01520 [Streptomyces sp. P9(2023)]|uniref:hypothetical protein n=1 Tax=Streptomyces sp. P9(2023) TaxID=3064394 RepID=UPI0028F3E604|nr:hypothetical protein [Streptomyces sp. P9(2023)]MDT9687045.1 hypothetical protein [Streptomyces sp. P9(2023)]